MEDRVKFGKQIWITRISRVNAEKRILSKEAFIQGVNIYYSIFTVCMSILSIVRHDDRMALCTVFLSIGLMVSIQFLNNQKYINVAMDYRNNYTELQKLEFDLEDNEVALSVIKGKYKELMKSNSNHISYDYYKALSRSNEDFKKEYEWEKKKKYLYWEYTWRVCVKAFVIMFPFIALALCEVLL